MLNEFDPFAAIQEAEGVTNLEGRASLLELAIEYLVSHGDPGSAETHYAIGYAWYLHPTENSVRDNEVVNHLSKALRINPEHKYARLYLAHHYFDHQQFSCAQPLLESFDRVEFSNVDQAWRDAKVAEMILCCRLYSWDVVGVRDALSRFCEALTNLEPGISPAPEELAITLISLMHQSKAIRGRSE